MAKFIPTDEQWEKMKNFIKGDKYNKEDFFVFETLAVGDKVVPNRYIRLTPALLEVMKQDAQKGVSLMLNHNWSQIGVQSIPIGKVFDARIGLPSQEGETQALYTTQYILRDDSKVDGYSKNDIINLIESGILADTSVGWGTDRESYKCNICGNSIYDWESCKHIPGQKYIINQETNEVKECIIQAEPPKHLHAGNNVLMENSIVFDGAYPNAIIQSAVGEVENKTGFKTLEGKQELKSNDVIIGYTVGGNVNLMYKELSEKGGLDKMDKMENEVPETNTSNEDVEEVVEEVVEETEEVVEETVENAEENAEESTETVEETTETTEETSSEENTMSVEETILNKFDNIASSVEELVMLAKEGLENRNAVIEEALESGVHSMGNAFNKEIFAKTFANMQTKDIKEMAQEWEKQAENKFVKEKVSKQDFSVQKQEAGMNLDMSRFKTDLY